MQSLAIIGAGAMGIFSACNIKNHKITILEAGQKPLAKVLLSGGTRCNLCNATSDIKILLSAYPRGANKLRKLFYTYPSSYIMDWFEHKKIALKIEDENRVFPVSNSSTQVCQTLIRLANIDSMRTGFVASKISLLKNSSFEIESSSQEKLISQKILISCGGKWNTQLKESLKKLGHTFIDEAPALFSFEVANANLKKLSGITLKNVQVKSSVADSVCKGDILITHKGLTGPAILKLSSFAAYELMNASYKFSLSIKIAEREFARDFLNSARKNQPKKMLKNLPLTNLSQNFWEFLLEKSDINPDICFCNFSKENEKQLLNKLENLEIEVVGKIKNKEEFVTAGGLNCDEVDFETMQSKLCKNLYFGGECLNIDAITGGYNLMSCWAQGLAFSRNLQ